MYTAKQNNILSLSYRAPSIRVIIRIANRYDFFFSVFISQTFEEASGYMRPERVNKWPNSMTDR
jgi:hypothetical protein